MESLSLLYVYLLWWNILTFILFILLTNVISFQFKESLPFYFPLVYLFTGGKLLSFYLSGKFLLSLLTLNWWPCWVENYWLEVLFCFFIYFMTLALLFFSPALYICRVTALWPVSLLLRQLANSFMWFLLYITSSFSSCCF